MRIQKRRIVSMYGFDGIRRDNYFRGEPVKKHEVKMRTKKLKNEKSEAKKKQTGKMI